MNSLFLSSRSRAVIRAFHGRSNRCGITGGRNGGGAASGVSLRLASSVGTRSGWHTRPAHRLGRHASVAGRVETAGATTSAAATSFRVSSAETDSCKNCERNNEILHEVDPDGCSKVGRKRPRPETRSQSSGKAGGCRRSAPSWRSENGESSEILLNATRMPSSPDVPLSQNLPHPIAQLTSQHVQNHNVNTADHARLLKETKSN